MKKIILSLAVISSSAFGDANIANDKPLAALLLACTEYRMSQYKATDQDIIDQLKHVYLMDEDMAVEAVSRLNAIPTAKIPGYDCRNTTKDWKKSQ
ncbi:TPA: hypothetical protein ACSTLY_003177 [Serratia fonticola]|uniref:hypothetical protein n=1 Tax=Serratia fonticola TaxID=47917 RepID=UPI0034C6B825